MGSHKRVCEAAAELAAADSPEARVVQYKLRLTFKDEDGDRCLLLNDADIKMAIQDRDKPLKVFAEILELSAVSADPPTAERPAPETQTRAEPVPETVTASRSLENAERHPPALHQAVESIVGVLANAVVGLNNNVAAANATSTTAPRDDSATTSETAASVASTDAAEETATPTAECAPEEPEQRFIHGRHTCDGCLTTPIVGKRFHAVNMQDYDLCANCKDDYRGNEIRFEEAELDRDRPMQERWHRRYAQRGKAGRPHLRKHGRRPFGRPRGFPPHGPPVPPRGPPAPSPPPQEETPHPPMCFGSSSPPFWASSKQEQRYPNMEEVDAALKEAIRRSMEDVKEAQTQTEAKKTSTEAVQTEPVKETEKSLENLIDLSKWQCDSCLVFNEEGSQRCAACQVQRGESAAAATDKPVNEVEEAPAETEEPEIVVEPETEPVPVVVPSSDSSAKSSTSPEKTPTDAEQSFSLDAMGQGDVAQILGDTMDQIANAIRAMDEEIARETSGSKDDNEDDDNEDDDNENETEAEEVKVDTASEENCDKGDVIVGGEEHEDEISQNSWDVVEDPTEHDESLARAACVIGSALFNSGMSESRNNSNAHTNSSDGSIGSVPTSVPSLSSQPTLPATLVQRWSAQLNQMHELGFFNDALTIDTLERLNAASIGSGEEEEISVTRVVNEMMKDW